MVSEAKEQVSAAISRANADLELALVTLEKIPSFDAASVAFAAHAATGDDMENDE